MPTPRTHYRIALGEYNDQHSWIIHSSKGIKWHNIPDDLITILKELTVNELLDFSLGSDGRWFVKYHQEGSEKQELSPYLWLDLKQGSTVELDRLTLGPDADHWGVHKAANGSFQRFRSVGNRHRFNTLLDVKTGEIDSNDQIWFVSLGFGGDWAFGVDGYVEHRCGQLCHTELSKGWKIKKKVSTIVLSPMAPVWIIVWKDGTLSHNLPTNIASEVEDYCQLQHSLRSNGDQSNSPRLNARKPQSNSQRPKARKSKPPRKTPQPASTDSSLPQTQQSLSNPTKPANPAPTPSSGPHTTQPLAAQTVQVTQVLPKTNHQLSPAPAPAMQPVRTLVPSSGSAQPTIKPTPPPPTVPPTATYTPSQQLNARSAPAPPPTLRQGHEVRPVARPVQPTATSPINQSAPAVQVAAYSLERDPRSAIAPQLNRPISMGEPLASVKPRVHAPPKKLSTTFRLLDPCNLNNEFEYDKVVDLFDSGWKHPRKRLPRIRRILKVSLPDHLNESYMAYKARSGLEASNGCNGINEKLLFHGAPRQCSFGDGEGLDSLCNMTACSFCSILRKSFLVSKASSGCCGIKMSGIYISSVSSKADESATSRRSSETKAVIVAKVVLGKGRVDFRTTQYSTEPPWRYRYDLVHGEGIDSDYERVLYQEEAIRPAYVVIYDQPIIVPPKVVTTLRLLDPYHPRDGDEYEEVASLFECGWKHPQKKCPRIQRIFAINLPDDLCDSYDAYRSRLKTRNGTNGVNEQLLFHGTPRHCSLGEGDHFDTLCRKTTCNLCGILRSSFVVSRAGSAQTFMRFGRGIYTSSVSSKADDYTNELADSPNKVIIVAKAALGKVRKYYRTTQSLTEPPFGYDSIQGEIGVDLNYDEQVLYQDEAIRPAYVIIYERPIRIRQASTTPNSGPRRPAQTSSSNSRPTVPRTSALLVIGQAVISSVIQKLWS